ncbi:MAG: hypothetical protein AAB907_02730, partial [Patescibacteria group bacterium]
MNDQSYDSLSKFALPNLRLVRLGELEDESILRVKKERSLREYCLTLKPYIILHMLNSRPEINSITFLDSDLYFFQSTDILYDELGNNSIGITRNNFPGKNANDMEKISGTFNAGFIIIKNDSRARVCMEWWRKKCLEFCSVEHGNGTYGEQLYMDTWPDKFEGVYIFKNIGANVAYWNIEGHQILTDANGGIKLRKKGVKISVPLVFYHFSGLTLYQVGKKVTYSYNRRYIPYFALQNIYQPYLMGLNWGYHLTEIHDEEKNARTGLKTEHMAEYYLKNIEKNALSFFHEYIDIPRLKMKIKKIVDLFSPHRRSYAINDLDLKLRPYLAGIRHGFFIEAGANDGISQSNTLYYEKNFGWYGMLIEAIPSIAKRCAENRPDNIIENVALVSSDYKKKILLMRYCNLMSTVKGGMKTWHEEDEHIEIGKKMKNINTYEIEVPVATLSSLLEK